MQITLDTCKFNPDYNWLLFTDDKTDYSYPENFEVVYCSFDELKKRIQNKFDFDLCIESPKKLCDFKPAYGYIFEEELKDFCYWGHCDLDQYFGNLSHFLTDDFLEKYDKIFTQGHMTIFHNTDSSNMLFMKGEHYKNIYGAERCFAFDEWKDDIVTINNLAEDSGMRICGDYPMLDVGPDCSIFIGSEYDLNHHCWTVDNKGSTIVSWDAGNMFAYTIEDDQIRKREILYVHIQKRHLKIRGCGLDNTLLFYPNTIKVGTIIDKKTIRCAFRHASIRNRFRIEENTHTCQLLIKKWKNRIKKVHRLWKR